MGRINVTARLKRVEGFPVLDRMELVVCWQLYVYAKDSRLVSYVRYSGVGVDILNLVMQSPLSRNIVHAEHIQRLGDRVCLRKLRLGLHSLTAL
jgi:hypothetical protein